jgi:hypothetical protein
VEERIKDIFAKRALHGLKRHLALDMLTSRMPHADRERENTLANNIKAKPEQLKLRKTYPSTWL